MERGDDTASASVHLDVLYRVCYDPPPMNKPVREGETIEATRGPVPCGIDPIPVLSAQSRLSPAPRCLCHRRRHCRCRLRRRCRRRRHILYTHFTMAQKARSSQRRPCEFGGMQLFAPEAWRAAPLALLLTRSAQMAQPTVRLPQL